MQKWRLPCFKMLFFKSLDSATSGGGVWETRCSGDFPKRGKSWGFFVGFLVEGNDELSNTALLLMVQKSNKTSWYGSLSHYLQGFFCMLGWWRISSINSRYRIFYHILARCFNGKWEVTMMGSAYIPPPKMEEMVQNANVESKRWRVRNMTLLSSVDIIILSIPNASWDRCLPPSMS